MAAGDDFAPASVHRVDPDGSVVQVATFSSRSPDNGSAITAAGVLLVNDVFGNRVTAFDLTPSGDLADRRTWASFATSAVRARFRRGAQREAVIAPDGGSGLHGDGNLWIADAGCSLRFD